MIANTFKCMKNLKLRTNQFNLLRNFGQQSKISTIRSLAVYNKFYFSNNEQPSGVDEGSHDDFVSKKKVGGVDGNNLTDEQALEMINKWVSGNKVCLFMKGDPKEPRCGYSNFVVQTLKFYKIKDYKSVDVLKYEVIRKQVKVYSNWPTFPQLYVDGKLVGGADIVQEMHKDGSLKELFSKVGLLEQ
ncbi:hypothetical protein ABPG72_004196 [Tetrahymena utriculariae]